MPQWNPTRPPRHCMVYDDTVTIGPLAKAEFDGVETNLYQELKKCNRGIIAKDTKFAIIIKREVWDAINVWAASGQFGGLALYEYLNKMFGTARV